MANVEIKEMWLVESDLNIKPVVVIATPDGSQTMYAFKNRFDKGDPSWYNVHRYKHERLFDTEGQAIDYRKATIDELRSKMPDVLEYIDRMDRISPDGKTEDFDFKREDYLGDNAPSDDDDTDGYYNDYIVYRNACRLLGQASRTGMLNLNAESVPVSEVVHVKWGAYTAELKDGDRINRYCATLTTRNGDDVRTRKKSEYIAVEHLFGENISDYTYTEQPIDKDDKDYEK